MGIPINERIIARREELGLTDTFVAEKVGLSIDEYWDVEAHEDELKEVVDLKNVKKISDFLNFNFFDLIATTCAFCENDEEYLEEYIVLPRNELLKKRRLALGATLEDYSDKINITESGVFELENKPDLLEIMKICQLEDISKVTEVPFQILANVKCNKCGR